MSYQISKQDGCYFLTFQVVQWVDVFSRPRYREYIVESLSFCVKNKGLIIYSYVIMTNHMHIICRAENKNLSDVIRDMKSFTSQRILNSIVTEPESRQKWMLDIFRKEASKHQRNETYQMWTHENHAEEVYSSRFTFQKINYIHQNPVVAGLVMNAHEYPYSSARDYAGNQGLVKVHVIDTAMLLVL